MRRVLAALSLLALAWLPGRATVAAPTMDGRMLSAPYANFGFDLLREVRDEHRNANVFVSPSSVAVALAIAANGASGSTRTAILKTLHAEHLSFEQFNAANAALVNSINNAKDVQLSMANALWVQQAFPVKPAFVHVAASKYHAQVGNLDFHSTQAVDSVNDWIKTHTNGRIEKMLDSIDPATIAMIANAVAFKGKWTVPFEKSVTKDHAFTTAMGASVTVPMMSHTAKYAYVENDALQAIRLPYGDEGFAAYVVLPRSPEGLDAWVRSQDEQRFDRLRDSMMDRSGTIDLPRFRITFSALLNRALTKLGMGVAFMRDADFSNVHQPPPPIVIDQVNHKSFLSVDEEGTEAAAATTIGMKTLAMIKEPPPFHMTVDHPFFLAIRDERSGQLLFAGTIADPRS